MIDLRHQMPFDLASWPHRLTLLRDGWRIEQICQYRPLVYYSVFDRPEIMEQFAISVRSLIEFGRYQGQIVVLTDRASPELARMLPAEYMDRVTIIPFQPHDRPGFMVARYLILDWPDAWRYQPLLYVDADIVFDRDVTPMLHAIAMSDRIAAPVELHVTIGPQSCRRAPRCCSATSVLPDTWRIQFRHSGNSECPCTRGDPATDPPDHRQPQSAAWP